MAIVRNLGSCPLVSSHYSEGPTQVSLGYGGAEVQASGKGSSSFLKVRTNTWVFSLCFPAGIFTHEHRKAASGS